MCEEILFDTAPSAETSFVALRYFNPVGAHPSGFIGEKSMDKPNNLVPCITQSAMGILPQVVIHGTDYPTRDGTCVRDYVHVMDLAAAHRLALEKIKNGRRNVEVVNIGTGNGVSVLEMVKTFEKTTGQKLNYKNGPRRSGDVVTIYSDTAKANRVLGWTPKYNVDDMMQTAWKWEQHHRNPSVTAK
jgi:UDP-glucose 4-epimerase